MVINDQAARRLLRAGGHPRQHTFASRAYGRGRRRKSSWVTAFATRTPATARPAAVRTATLTASSAWSGTIGSEGGGGAARRGFGVAPGAVRGGFAASVRDVFAAIVRGVFAAVVRGAFALAARGAFAAGAPAASAFAAASLAAFAGVLRGERGFAPAAPAESRFALRFPGRELGRFPSTPPSSAMAGDSRRARSGYIEGATPVDKVV
jgi:hypothetical protein